MLLCYSIERKAGEKKKKALFLSVKKKKNDHLSKNNVRRTPTIPVLSQMSHPIDLGQPGSHLALSLKSHIVRGMKDIFFHF